METYSYFLWIFNAASSLQNVFTRALIKLDSQTIKRRKTHSPLHEGY